MSDVRNDDTRQPATDARQIDKGRAMADEARAQNSFDGRQVSHMGDRIVDASRKIEY